MDRVVFDKVYISALSMVYNKGLFILFCIKLSTRNSLKITLRQYAQSSLDNIVKLRRIMIYRDMFDKQSEYEKCLYLKKDMLDAYDEFLFHVADYNQLTGNKENYASTLEQCLEEHARRYVQEAT